MNPLYPIVAEKRCEYCRAPERIFNFGFEVEHIQPRSAGGNKDWDNLALACEACNLHKAAATSGWDDETGQTVSLYHPRQNRWHEHFRFDSETHTVQGMTAIGRVTIVRLKINSEAQIYARQQWVTLGLYP